MEQINRANAYYKAKFGCKIYKLSLNGGMTCPNRDGTLDTRGCIFCSKGGSGDFASSAQLSISEQITQAKSLVSNKIHDGKYIAYFQAFTNTYADVSYLRKLYYEAIEPDDIVGISIATRPDCLNEEILSLISEVNQIKPVSIELGLQTSHETSSEFIRRGYDLSVFEKAIASLFAINIDIVVHLIIGLPFETEEMILETIQYLNQFPIQGIKLQLLHVLKDTDLADYYRQNQTHFHILSLEEYTRVIGACIEHLRPDIVIHRMTGDGNKKELIAPMWSADKKKVLNYMNNYFAKHEIVQGRMYSNGG